MAGETQPQAGALEAQLARFAAELRWDELPARVRERVQDIAIDAVGSALAGATAEGIDGVRATAAALGGGKSSVIGGGELSLAGATMLNGHLITAVTICDVYRPALCHVMPEVLPPALAIAEAHDLPGRDLLAAIAAGVELTVRIGRALDYPRFRERGWHSPGVIGPFGGAAAVSRLLHPGGERMLDAIGLAGSQSAGTFAGLGTPAIKFHQARGALSGLLAGLAAADGFGGSHTVLTNEDGGLLPLYAGGGEPQAALEGLGEQWELEWISLRRWPVASSLQSVVACMLSMIERVELTPEAVQSIEISLPNEGYELCARMKPSESLAARQAPGWVAGIVLYDKACWLEQFDPSRLADAAVQEFAEMRTTVRREEQLPTGGAALRVELHDGSTLELARELAPGDPGDPLTREAIREKLLLAASSLGACAAEAEAALDTVERLADSDSTAAVAAKLRLVQDVEAPR